MRITPEILMKLAQDAVSARTKANPLIVAAYLSGSVLADSPLIGDTTDIDLFFIHSDDFEIEREIVRITDDVHFDIVHSAKREFRQVRELRLHPWWGPTFYGCKILYDPQHFVDFIQASVRGQYERPDHVLERSRPLIERARQIWFSFGLGNAINDVEQVRLFLQALGLSANAIALLSGDPLTERRFLSNFVMRANAVHSPGLISEFMGLLNASQFDPGSLSVMSENWDMTFELVQKHNPPSIFGSNRRNYYNRAFSALISGQTPSFALWPLLSSWTNLIAIVPDASPAYRIWHDTCYQMKLIGDEFSEKVEALDAFLDVVEETIERWAEENGA